MPDETKLVPEPMSDEGIDSIVNLVEAAELLGKSLDMPTSVALRTMLKSWQIMAKMMQKNQMGFLSRMSVGKPS